MKDQKKAKWILGTSGVIVSALLFTQINDVVESSPAVSNESQFTEKQMESMTKREKELVSLDWTNFEIVSINSQQSDVSSDGKTRRS